MRKVILLVLDGAGYHADPHGNAVTSETLPSLFAQMDREGFAVLAAAEESVGLEAGQVGNSEAGHLTIGAGRMIPSMCRRILEAHGDGSWAADPAWGRVGSVLHLVGLLSDAGVHGLDRTIGQAAANARANGVAEVVVHPILDGVDSLAGTAPALLARLRETLAGLDGVRLGVIQGRKHTNDRSGDLDFTRVATDALRGVTELPTFDDALLADHLTREGESTFPAHLAPGGRTIADGEPVLQTSHRADRARQLVRVLSETQPMYLLVEPGEGIPREHVFLPQPPVDGGLAQVLKGAGLESVRIAEKCKFPHVTFFFNGFDAGAEGEGRCIPSIPEAEIRTNPAMSAEEVTDAICAALAEPDRRVVVANLANLDQVGHLGDVELARQAAAAVDAAYTRIAEAARQHGWTLLVTSDHGNAERCVGDDGGPFGSHTERPVPFFAQAAPDLRLRWTAREGSLANVAGTLLTALDVPLPADFEPSLLEFEPAN